MLISVDPGVRACGCAVWHEGQLQRAALVRNPFTRGQDAAAALAMGDAVLEWWGMGRRALGHELAIECPRVYEATFQKGDQNTSIIPLSLVVGAVTGALGLKTHQFFPRDWKGTCDADRVLIPLVQSRISPAERARVQLPSESLAHNVWDGVGVGLKLLGRLEPRRVFAKEP